MALAIFDLDHTLIPYSSDYLWIQFLLEKKLVLKDTYVSGERKFYQDYLDGTLDFRAYIRFLLEPLKKFCIEELEEIRERFMQEKIIPIIPRYSRELIEGHRARGDFTLIITASNRFITEKIAEALVVEDLIASEIEVIKGRFTGRVLGVPSFQEGKVIRLEAWIRLHLKFSLQESTFYSDSYNDLPLLEIVDYPVVVNGDKKLLEVAREKKWKIMELQE